MSSRKCSVIIAAALFFLAVNCRAGNLDSSGSPAPTMKTLTDIMNRISTGTVAGTHSLQPSSVPDSVMYTLTDIYNAIPGTTSVTEADVKNGVTFIKRESGVMKISTGTCAGAGVPATGQTTSYATGDDGDLEKGTAWPNPRFTDNGDGTITDNLTNLVWLSSANYINTNYPSFDTDGTAGDGRVFWQSALNFVAGMNAGTYGNCGHTDWRLPNMVELYSLVAFQYSNPVLSDTAGTGQWSSGDPFTIASWLTFWSSTTCASLTGCAWCVDITNGDIITYTKTTALFVWPVRGGQ